MRVIYVWLKKVLSLKFIVGLNILIVIIIFGKSVNNYCIKNGYDVYFYDYYCNFIFILEFRI